MPDFGSPGYGISVRLAGFPASRPVRLEVEATDVSNGLALEETTDADGRWGPWMGALPDPVGVVTVTALESENGPVLATATLGDPCLAPVWQP